MVEYNLLNIGGEGNLDKDTILIIYTGGTLGMAYDESGALTPFDFVHIEKELPYLKQYNLKLKVISFENPIDSSNMNIGNWIEIAEIIQEYYEHCEGFVILHGTDTMAYTASALSYILEGLSKPVIFTGSQLPIGVMRSDARENLFTSIEIAAAREKGLPVVSEVCIFFNSQLLRGCRASKVRSSHFSAFESENYPVLANAGILIDFNKSALKPYEPSGKLEAHKKFDENVVILKLFPNIERVIMNGVLNIPGLKGVVLETFGSGNAPTQSWFINCLKNAIQRGIVIFNVSQCMGGKVLQGRYETSRKLQEIGVISGVDITTEAAITKMMFLLGKENSINAVKGKLITPISGEMA